VESGEWRVGNGLRNLQKQMSDSILRDKSFAFALRILKLGDFLEEKRQFSIKDQITRSGTSIGANIREGRNAQGQKDLINKLSIALKEADETQYWLELLCASNKITQIQFDSLNKDLDEIISMLIASIKTLKSKL
jgi:four helix bundle protein